MCDLTRCDMVNTRDGDHRLAYFAACYRVNEVNGGSFQRMRRQSFFFMCVNFERCVVSISCESTVMVPRCVSRKVTEEGWG